MLLSKHGEQRLSTQDWIYYTLLQEKVLFSFAVIFNISCNLTVY